MMNLDAMNLDRIDELTRQMVLAVPDDRIARFRKNLHTEGPARAYLTLLLERRDHVALINAFDTELVLYHLPMFLGACAVDLGEQEERGRVADMTWLAIAPHAEFENGDIVIEPRHEKLRRLATNDQALMIRNFLIRYRTGCVRKERHAEITNAINFWS